MQEIRNQNGNKTEIVGQTANSNGHGNGHKVKYAFSGYNLDPEARTVVNGKGEIRLAHRPFDVLSFLIENRDRVVSRNELLDKFWDGHEVYDDALRKCVASIRKSLNDTAKPGRIIETRYGDGYRFIADVVTTDKNGSGNGQANGNGNGYSSALAIAAGQKNAASRRSFPMTAIVVGFLLIASLSFAAVLYSSRSSGAAGPKPVHSIAVMPLKNMTGDAGNDYFCDGVTESVITHLSRGNDLKVISRTSTFTFKDKEIDPRDIGRQLGVDALLEGSIKQEGERVTVRVRLVSTEDGSIIWTSNDFERPITNAYDLEDAIACEVAVGLKTEICGPDQAQKARNGIAYQEYLKGRYEWNKRTSDGIKRSIEHYERAIKLDPTYSLAYSGLSESYAMGLWYVPFPSGFAVPKAAEAVKKAVELDDNSAEAHVASSSVASLEWRWDDAAKEIKRAIEINPNLARAFHVQAFLLTALGRYDEAIASIRRAHEIDPLNSVIKADTAHILLHGHRADPSRVEQAIAECNELIATDPNYAETYDYLATAALIKRDADEYSRNLIEGLRRRSAPEAQIAKVEAAGKRGGIDGIIRVYLDEELAKVSSGSYSPVLLGVYYGSLGEKAQSLKWLNRAVDEHNAEIIGLAQTPYLDPIRDEPEFKEILKRVGLSTPNSEHD